MGVRIPLGSGVAVIVAVTVGVGVLVSVTAGNGVGVKVSVGSGVAVLVGISTEAERWLTTAVELFAAENDPYEQADLVITHR